MGGVKARDPYERIMERIQVVDGCWIWPGAQVGNGYGQIHVSPKFSDTGKAATVLVHRVVWVKFRGPIVHELDHLCRHRACCNPEHLEDVTRLVNANRGEKSLRGLLTQCKQGHPYPENAMRRSNGYVYCGECNRRRTRRWKRDQAALAEASSNGR